jgi:hypothetical protein
MAHFLGLSPAAGSGAVSQIEKETNERRTSNIERPTSNIVFCHFIKKLRKVNLPFENLLSLDHVFSLSHLF